MVDRSCRLPTPAPSAWQRSWTPSPPRRTLRQAAALGPVVLARSWHPAVLQGGKLGVCNWWRLTGPLPQH